MATLKAHLRDMLTQARKNEPIPARRTLTGGLAIEVSQLSTGDVRLTIDRRDVQPSEQEWRNVINHWPEPIPDDITPTRHRDGKRYSLVARWPRPITLLDESPALEQQAQGA